MKPIKIEIDGVEYTVKIPVFKYPIITYAKEQLLNASKSFDEAKKRETELKKVYEDLKEYFTPEIDEEVFVVALFKIDIELSKRVMQAFQAGNFTADKENPLSK